MCALTIGVDTHVSVWVHLVGTYILNLGVCEYPSCCHCGMPTSFCLALPLRKKTPATDSVVLLSGSVDLAPHSRAGTHAKPGQDLCVLSPSLSHLLGPPPLPLPLPLCYPRLSLPVPSALSFFSPPLAAPVCPLFQAQGLRSYQFKEPAESRLYLCLRSNSLAPGCEHDPWCPDPARSLGSVRPFFPYFMAWNRAGRPVGVYLVAALFCISSLSFLLSEGIGIRSKY